MKDFFFGIDYSDTTQALLKALLLIALSGLLLYLLHLVFSKALFRKSKQRREINLRLSFLWALFALFILYNVYIFVIFYLNGLNSFHWDSPRFYLGVSAPLVIYLGLLTYFLLRRRSLHKLIQQDIN